MTDTLYPLGYGTTLVNMATLRARHEPNAHPEFARRLFAWLEHKDGEIGIGGGWRAVQPVKPGFAPPGMSFHESQQFASGFFGYSAVDLVARNPGKIHRAPTWAESDDAPTFGLHTFITGEPWHIQPIEIRGYQSWVNAGRPDPAAGFPLPGDIPETTPSIPDLEDDDMQTAQLLRIAAGRVDPVTWGPTVVLRNGPLRRVNAGPDLKFLTDKLGNPRDVIVGSDEETWLIREVHGYDRYVGLK